MIDIIIPVYNVSKYLDECLNSFIKQYDGSFDIVLVDDGSTDESGKMCDEYASKHSYIKVLHKQNGGLSSARNYGTINSNGDYIFFFDSDDYIADNAINRINEKINSGADLIFIEDIRFNDDDYSETEYIRSHISNEVIKSNDKDKILNHLLTLPRMRVAAWSFIFKRSNYSKEQLLFKEGIALEDVPWTPHILINATKYAFIDGPLYCYRVRGDSLSHSKINEWKLTSLKNSLQELMSKESTNKYQWYLNGFASDFFTQYMKFVAKNKEYRIKENIKFIKDNKWILKYGKNKKSKIARFFVSIFGVKMTLKIMGIIL